MRNISLLPNIITAFGLACGLFVIFKMSMTPIGTVSVDVLVGIAGILILSAFADLLDGAIARVMKAESEFGGLFDSLADAISFGVAPAVVVLKTLSVEPGTSYSFLITFAAMVFTVCGVLRLIRFNINKNKIQHDDELLAAAKKNFTGLPIPAACGACISANLYLAKWASLEPQIFSKEVSIWIMVIVLTFLGYMMISRFRFPSLKSLHIKVASFKIVFLSILLTLLLFFGILHDFPLTFFAVSWLYLVVSLILYLARMIAGKRAKTLEDFEPAPEEEEEV